MNKSGDVVFKSCHIRSSVYDVRYIDDQNKKPLLIFCHGFKGFKDWGHFNLITDAFCLKGLIVLKFNFTFNGGTTTNPIDFPDLNAFAENNYLKEVEDVHHIISLCKSGEIKLSGWNGEIFLLGHSRGGGIVTIVANENKAVKKVVSWAGISNCINRLPDENILNEWEKEGVRHIMNGRTHQNMPMNYQFVKTLQTHKSRLSIMDAAQKMKIPHLIIHGSEDQAVSIKEAYDIKSWNPNAKLFEIKGSNHVFGGKHPWLENKLPDHSVMAIHKTLQFLL